MNILITGAKGFAGKNLVANLYTIKDGKNRTRPEIQIDEIFEYDIDSTSDELREYCSKADFVFHLAGINRPKEASEFSGNYGILGTVLNELKSFGNKAPVMLSSSVSFSSQCFGPLYMDSAKAAGTRSRKSCLLWMA